MPNNQMQIEFRGRYRGGIWTVIGPNGSGSAMTFAKAFAKARKNVAANLKYDVKHRNFEEEIRAAMRNTDPTLKVLTADEVVMVFTIEI